MKKRIWILFVAMAVLSVPAFGQRFYYDDEITTDEVGWSDVSSVSQGEYMDNPCTPAYDSVWVNYSLWVEGAQQDLNVERYRFDESTNVGGSYAATGASLTDVAYAQPITIRQYHKVNTPDQFHVVTIINWDPYTRGTTLSLETACGDGTPFSAQ